MGAYHLTEKCVWGVESIMVSDLPVYSWNATSVSVWIQKRAKFYRESGTEKEPRNWLIVNNIPFGSYQPEWKDYLKTYSSIFGWNFRKVNLPFTFHPEFPKFSVKWYALHVSCIITSSIIPSQSFFNIWTCGRLTVLCCSVHIEVTFWTGNTYFLCFSEKQDIMGMCYWLNS